MDPCFYRNKDRLLKNIIAKDRLLKSLSTAGNHTCLNSTFRADSVPKIFSVKVVIAQMSLHYSLKGRSVMLTELESAAILDQYLSAENMYPAF